MLQFKRMYLVITFLYAFFIVTLPTIVYWLVNDILKINTGTFIWALVLVGYAIFAWFVAPIAGYRKAREAFFGKNNAKNKQLPPKERMLAIITSIIATALGYLLIYSYFFLYKA